MSTATLLRYNGARYVRVVTGARTAIVDLDEFGSWIADARRDGINIVITNPLSFTP